MALRLVRKAYSATRRGTQRQRFSAARQDGIALLDLIRRQVRRSAFLRLRVQPVARRWWRERIVDTARLLANVFNSFGDIPRVVRDARRARRLVQSLRRLSLSMPLDAEGRIPPLIHFVYGFGDCGEFPYYARRAIESAIRCNPHWTVIVHAPQTPAGAHWAAVADHIIVHKIEDFDYYGCARFIHYAHKTDLVRLLILREMGGGYLDVDTLTIRGFDELRDNEVVLGVQPSDEQAQGGLSNAVILAKPKSGFISAWLASYRTFRSNGIDARWDYHAATVPIFLAAKFPGRVKILGHRAFCSPSWRDTSRILLSPAGMKFAQDFEQTYVFHFWTALAPAILDGVDEAFVDRNDTIYARFAQGAGYVEMAEEKALAVRIANFSRANTNR